MMKILIVLATAVGALAAVALLSSIFMGVIFLIFSLFFGIVLLWACGVPITVNVTEKILGHTVTEKRVYRWFKRIK
jgi:vacuolar-type H+-ATPase subunit I/STV1